MIESFSKFWCGSTRATPPARATQFRSQFRKVDIRLPGKGDSNSHGARPVHQKHRWVRTSRLPIKNSLSQVPVAHPHKATTGLFIQPSAGTSILLSVPSTRLLGAKSGFRWHLPRLLAVQAAARANLQRRIQVVRICNNNSALEMDSSLLGARGFSLCAACARGDSWGPSRTRKQLRALRLTAWCASHTRPRLLFAPVEILYCNPKGCRALLRIPTTGRAKCLPMLGSLKT